MKKALIFGVTGQDGSYLAELLLQKDYEVHGVVRRVSAFNRQRIDKLRNDPRDPSRQITLHYGDIGDASSIRSIIQKTDPDEIYNLAAQSQVRISFDIPEYTADVTGLGTLRILEAAKDYETASGKKLKFYQASSSEMFGSEPPPQNEKTPFHPRSPYAIAKVFGYWTTVNYREAYGIHAVNGILFNHESERRGESFVTRKITLGIAQMKAGKAEKIYLGNLEAKRDWGYAPEYVEIMWRMLQEPQADDYVIGTGESHSVREFAEAAFKHAGFDLAWQGTGESEKGVDRASGKVLVEIDPRYYRPAEVDNLVADARKAKEKLGWAPKVKFDELARIMVDADVKEGLGLKGLQERSS